VCVLFGEAFEVEKILQKEGIYPEFCDGECILFYLSPACKKEDIDCLKNHVFTLLEQFPYTPKMKAQRIHTPLVLKNHEETEWVDLSLSTGRICALNCGLFPPCTPLLFAGERIEKEKIALLEKADNVFGLKEKKILVLKEERKHP
jgi:arginine/lysine/ornithine decarboxylase